MKSNKCVVQNCNEKSNASGYCSKHYKFLTKNAIPVKTTKSTKIPQRQMECNAEGCKNGQNFQGYCQSHSRALRFYGDVFYFSKLREHKKFLRNHSANSIYYTMLSRANPTNKNCNENYYNRGIRVCDRWLIINNGLENFINDMGERPSKKHTLDRIDNDKGYSPENCKWSTYSEQANNRRGNVFMTLNGKTQTVSQWSKELGILRETISWRMKNGYSIEECLQQGKLKRKARKKV